MTDEELRTCQNFINKASAISQQEVFWEMRQRYQMNSKLLAEEAKIHLQSQIKRWQEVKAIFENNQELLLKYAKSLQDSDIGKEIITEIHRVIEEEIEHVLLNEPYYNHEKEDQ